jgi:hypothetical protein
MFTYMFIFIDMYLHIIHLFIYTPNTYDTYICKEYMYADVYIIICIHDVYRCIQMYADVYGLHMFLYTPHIVYTYMHITHIYIMRSYVHNTYIHTIHLRM